MKLEINFWENGDWVNATVENFEGDLLGEESAPIVEGATFDVRSAVIRSAVEKALFELKAEEDR
jgi:hypothetical protein